LISGRTRALAVAVFTELIASPLSELHHSRVM
jgi:hypothetical protein